jgi:peptidoglycan/LPS O-acetylase OafA/YrhL
MNENENYWPELSAFFKRRLRRPVGHPTYWIYFAVVVVVIGGIGVWKAVFFDQTLQAVASNLMTFFPALAAASAFEIALNKDEEKVPKSAKTSTLLVGIAMIFSIWFVWKHDVSIWGLLIASGSSVVSLLLWWVANADNASLLDLPTKRGTVGDNPSVATKGTAGKFKV